MPVALAVETALWPVQRHEPGFLAVRTLAPDGDVAAARRACRWAVARLQVIGYVLLDYHVSYRIGRAGWYLTRHGHLVTWTVPECLSLLGARHGLAELRQMLAARLATSARAVVGTTPKASR